ncbi:RING Zn finger-containing protein [Heterostelium album PN500]|uniref:RING Zn finger-containing protein n=1 Tax=Heterostelium pallidum (strain ATCC 26659 / Pp 5 / PN500) TaxID=670386 RepID=D3BT72_HETP5|nr:RING Zn finger-containing protein [Heterostelium album PN500]EFA75289.1 RING Zn finger-containing protein [Heterostelium album PN500]|eukprot:XP_020427423.1 RING Zn finger-containing protein [Heterostelium album PN500]
MSKLEQTLKKEQSQKIKAQDTVTKLNVSIKEKDNIIASLSQALKISLKENPTSTSTKVSSPGKQQSPTSSIKDLTEMLSQAELVDSQRLKNAADGFVYKAMEIQIQELNREKEKLMETVEQLQSKTTEFHNVQSLIEKRFAVDSLKVEHLVGDKLEELNMKDLDRLEEIHHKGLKAVGMAKQNLLTQQLLKLQKEKEESQICLVCADRSINTILLPCKHRCLCDQCSNNLSSCPLCRSVISDKIKYY